jgi:hypothetical protein
MEAVRFLNPCAIEGAEAMPLVCPQCKQIFEHNGICPECKVVLLFHAQNLQREPATASPVDDDSSPWQQTPWGRIAIGLILAQGLSFGLQQLLTAGFIAGGESSETWQSVLGVVVYNAVFAVSLLIGGALSGAGQSRGMVYGALVGFVSGLLTFFMSDHRGDPLWFYAEPIIHLAAGALGGALGMVIWRPAPRLPELEPSNAKAVSLPTLGTSLARAFAGPIHPARVCAGVFFVVVGVVWSHAILEFLLRASNLAVSSKLQAQLVTMEISGLIALIGAAFAGATSLNGLKQGLCVGIGAAVIVIGVQFSDPKFTLESAVFTITGIVGLSMVGGWFGSQLFPPLDPRRRKKRFSYNS